MKNKKIIVKDIGRTEFSYSWRYQESIFDKISSEWWDKDGPMKMLHSMNETRILFIK